MTRAEKRLEKLIAQIVERSSELDYSVLLLICKRLRQIGEKGSLTKEQKAADLERLKKELRRHNILQRADINRLLEDVSKDVYMESELNYKLMSVPFIPYSKNKAIQKILTEAKIDVANSDVFKTQGFMLRDPKTRKLTPNTVSETYNKIINDAAEKATDGSIDYFKAIRETVKQLNDSGVRHIQYESESGKMHSQSIESAVKRNILDNVRDINQKTQDEVGKQYGADGKEITVHEHPAVDHAPIQGHQFTNEEWEKLQNGEAFQDVNGKHFEPIKRAIGTLNCRHFAYSILVGINKPNFTEEQLQEVLDRNEEGYTDEDGKHRTLYECTQEQRRLERILRKAKRGQVMAKEAGEMDLAKQYQYEVDTTMVKYNDFCKKCGLPKHPENFRVPGYRRLKI